MKTALLISSALAVSSALAEFVPVFQLGDRENGSEGLGRSNGRSNDSPGSATTRDDHFYFSGTYPGVGTVSDEALENFEASFRADDPVNEVFFQLSPAQRNRGGLLRFQINFGWGSHWDGETAENQIAFSFNGNPATFVTPTFLRSEFFSFELPADSPIFQNGSNRLTMTRTGTERTYIDIEFLTLEHDATALQDTDNDGATDAWELRTAYDPNNANRTPPTWGGAIGINFRSRLEPDDNIWPAGTPNGFIAQPYWNQTRPLIPWGTGEGTDLRQGDIHDIISPRAGVITDSAGAATNLTFSFEHNGAQLNHLTGSIERELLNGFILNRNDRPTRITLGNIPYSRYDLYLYVASNYSGLEGEFEVAGETRRITPINHPVGNPFLMWRPLPQEDLRETGTVLVFSDLDGTSQTILFHRLGGATGICALQIIDRQSDYDGDGVPDYWEFQFRSDAGVSNANSDSDNDTLSLLNEYQQNSNPNFGDTDNDGLGDAEEFTLGSNPNLYDSDADGRSDFEEVRGPLTSNPTLTDSDGDGFSDLDEAEVGIDPGQASYSSWPIPTITENSFRWEASDVQLVRNHAMDQPTGGGDSRELLRWQVRNRDSGDYTTISFTLRVEEGRTTWSFWCSPDGGFFRGQRWGLYAEDRETDLSSALGFAGSGTHDISDPLTFSVVGTKTSPTANEWTMTIGVQNQHTNSAVFSHVWDDASSSNIFNTDNWGVYNETGYSEFNASSGVEVFRTPTRLETLPSFSAYLDSDNDGLFDSFETSNGLDPNNPADALLDPDNDGLNNLAESRLGTAINDDDSDDDGVKDGLEWSQFSNPRDPDSTPPWLTGTLPSGTDQNSNGMSDLWESYFGTSVRNQDPDGDGYENWREAIFGTNPYDAESRFDVTLTHNNDPTATLSFSSLAGKEHVIESANGLSGFTPTSITPTLSGDTYQATLPTSDGTEFFRVTARDLDQDNDGLSDWDELILGSSPTEAHSVGRPVPYDSNNDGTPDGELSGDYIAYLEQHQNQGRLSDLSGGDPAPAPTRIDAARLLMQASFGPTLTEIEEVRTMGLREWIEDQIENVPPTHLEDYIRQIKADLQGPKADDGYARNREGTVVNTSNIQTAFARAAVSGKDQLRQRVALALSEILVISRRDGAVNPNVQAIARYYDRFVDHAFGNYYDILMGVTLDANMGRYLSHLGNRPPDPENNLFPDENYAREIMQLFSIGVWELNQDGTRKLDAQGNPIPTYGNPEITEMARVMTGLWYGDRPWGYGGDRDQSYLMPMRLHPEYHDFGEKQLLNGFVLPAREPSEENGLRDIEDTVRHLIEHPSCAPFISRALIQFLVTSNPSPDYVRRVADIFVDNGSGVRGDLRAVIRAILLDREARDPNEATRLQYGIFREPLIRTMHQARLLNMNRSGELLWWDFDEFSNASLQAPLDAPSVFNYFRPDYSPPGILDDLGLDAPAMEITSSYTTISFPNLLWNYATRGYMAYNGYQIQPDYSQFMPWADDPKALLDQLNLVICSGSMSAKTRQDILDAINFANIASKAEIPRLALFLALMSPDGAVQR